MLFLLIIPAASYSFTAFTTAGPSVSRLTIDKKEYIASGAEITLAGFTSEKFTYSWSLFGGPTKSTWSIPELPGYWLSTGYFVVFDKEIRHIKNFYAETGINFFVNVGFSFRYLHELHDRDRFSIYFGGPLPLIMLGFSDIFVEPFIRQSVTHLRCHEEGFMVKMIF